ncbi:hypothetical protein AB0D59_48080 [Streptomyces sp. NPDC048417]|uniref:hypothetical protein n=1 Tax=Streptomyces sp. NPDC048417 TaxID=3155387 RepID=UPI00341D6761
MRKRAPRLRASVLVTGELQPSLSAFRLMREQDVDAVAVTDNGRRVLKEPGIRRQL